MKKLFFFSFVVAATLQISAQTTGWNGVNFNKYATDADKLALLDVSGNTAEFRYRIDKDQVINTEAVIDYAYDYKAAGKQLNIVVTAKAAAVDFNFEVVDQFYKAGIVPFVELGNERYAQQFKHTFESYIGEFQSTIDKIKSVYPNTVFIVNVMPRPEGSSIPGPKKGSGAWNASAYQYVLSHPGTRISWHMYPNEKDFAVLDTVPSGINFNPTAVDSRLPVFYDQLAAYNCQLPLQIIEYLSQNFPGIYCHFTEIGIVPSEDESLDNADAGTSLIRNTVAYSGVIFQLLHKLHEYPFTASVDIHAGITLNGLIAPPSKFDFTTSGNVKKMEFFAFELFNETGKLPELPASLNLIAAGTYRYYLNYNHPAPVITIADGYTLITNVRFISGPSWLTSGGAGFMAKGTSPVATYPGVSFANAIPAAAWGYVEFIVEKNPEPVVCYKERLFFKSLGCKVDKKCTINNCK